MDDAGSLVTLAGVSEQRVLPGEGSSADLAARTSLQSQPASAAITQTARVPGVRLLGRVDPFVTHEVLCLCKAPGAVAAGSLPLCTAAGARRRVTLNGAAS